MVINISLRPAPISPMSTMHWAAAAIGGDVLDARLAQLEARAADGKLAPGRPAIDICRGIKAFADGDNDGAIRLLEPAMVEVVRIGGSHAQRELWEDTLIVAYLRGGHAQEGGRPDLDPAPAPAFGARDAAWSA